MTKPRDLRRAHTGEDGEGVTPGEDVTRYQQTPKANRATDIRPQLLNPIDEERAQLLLLDPAWWAREKLDGRRALVHRRMREVVGINRQGLIVDLPKPIIENARRTESQQSLLDVRRSAICSSRSICWNWHA